MRALLILPALAVCGGLLAEPAAAEDNHFLGQWQWSKERSKLAPNEPAPRDVKANIQTADGGAIRWTADLVDQTGQKHSESFNGKPDGSFYPVQGAGQGVTASFKWNGGALESVFRHTSGGSDSQSCHVEANKDDGVQRHVDGRPWHERELRRRLRAHVAPRGSSASCASAGCT